MWFYKLILHISAPLSSGEHRALLLRVRSGSRGRIQTMNNQWKCAEHCAAMDNPTNVLYWSMSVWSFCLLDNSRQCFRMVIWCSAKPGFRCELPSFSGCNIAVSIKIILKLHWTLVSAIFFMKNILLKFSYSFQATFSAVSKLMSDR